MFRLFEANEITGNFCSSAALNQKLSMERADNVLTFLEQDGNIPLTNVLALGALGTTNQAAIWFDLSIATVV